MKRILVLLLAAALVLSCCACAPKGEQTEDKDGKAEISAVFPSGTVLCGTDVAGMTAEEAEAAVKDRAASYVLTLDLDGKKQTFTAEDLALQCGTTDYAAILEGCLADEAKREITVDGLITYDPAKIEAALSDAAGDGTPAKNARLEYNEKKQAFELLPEEQGGGLNLDAVLEAVKAAVPQLQETVKLDKETLYQPAEITADSKEAKEALEKANKMLDVQLSYTFAPEGRDAATETLTREEIASFLTIDEDGLTVEIDPAPLQEYVSRMDEAHSVASGTSKFKTTGGSYIDVRVPSAGQTVDTDALYTDIFDCITKGVSGERTAPYAAASTGSSNFGGNYVEIDLSAQHMWVYNGGECVVSTDIVSGCVNTGHATPAGVYTIKSKETNRYLVGPGYKSWVNFWMPFNGGIGLHDADGWRWVYGGSIYQYSGSHGCINLPYSAAQNTYNNISVGTYVILYGGVSSVTPIQQSISGTSSYSAVEGGDSFRLDASPAYSTTLSYSSDNTSVATVSLDGVVTIVGPGTATITVTAGAKSGYTSATKTVTITVNSKCSQGDHSWNDGTVTQEPTCTVEGVRTYTCTSCGQTRTEAIAKKDHSSDSGTVTKAPTCGAVGVRTYSCTSCGTVLRTEEIPATGNHSWDGGTVTKEPSCIESGTKTYTCTVCGQQKTEELPALGHSYENGTCTRCGAADPAAGSAGGEG